MTVKHYVATYSQVISIVPADFLGWHGLTTPHGMRLAGAPSISIEEPRRRPDGEPMSRRRARPQPRIVRPERVARQRPRWPGETLVRGLGGLADGFAQGGPLPVGSL